MHADRLNAGMGGRSGYIDGGQVWVWGLSASDDTVISVNWEKHKQTRRILQTRSPQWIPRVWVCCRAGVCFDMLRIIQSVGRRYEYQNKWQTINNGRYAGGGGGWAQKLARRRVKWNAVKCNKGSSNECRRGGQIGKRAGAVWNWKWNSSPVETSGSADTQGAVKLKCRNTRDKSGKTPGTIAELQLCQKCKTLELSMYTC